MDCKTSRSSSLQSRDQPLCCAGQAGGLQPRGGEQPRGGRELLPVQQRAPPPHIRTLRGAAPGPAPVTSQHDTNT